MRQGHFLNLTCDLAINKGQRHVTLAFLKIDTRHGDPPSMAPRGGGNQQTSPHSMYCEMDRFLVCIVQTVPSQALYGVLSKGTSIMNCDNSVFNVLSSCYILNVNHSRSFGFFSIFPPSRKHLVYVFTLHTCDRPKISVLFLYSHNCCIVPRKPSKQSTAIPPYTFYDILILVIT